MAELLQGARRRFRVRSIFRSSQRRRPNELAAGIVVAYLALSISAYALTTAIGGLAVLWLCNGMVAAAVLLLPPRSALVIVGVGASTDFLCSVVLGHTAVGQSALIATLDASEGLLAAFLARQVCGAALDVTRVPRLLRLLVLAILPACLLVGSLGTALSRFSEKTPVVLQWIAWAGGDILGMAIALPASLLIARPERFGGAPRQAWISPLIVALTAAVAAAVFAQQEVPALILLVVIAVIFGTFLQPPAGVAVTIVAVALVASGLTLSGYGPIHAEEPADLGRRVLTLQLFVASVAISGLVGAALVAERDRSVARLGKALAGAQASRRRAQAAAASKARFLGTVSHEMRTPLNGVLGQAAVLERRDDLALDAREALGALQTSARTLTALIEDVLDFSQLDAGDIRLALAPTDVPAVLEQVAALGRALQVPSGPVVRLAPLPQAAHRHLLDAERVSRVVFQLVANAMKFSDAGEVLITASLIPVDETHDLWRITVSDDGPGIPEEALGRIFDPFHQADGTATRRHGGLGLGLALCRSLVEAMDGRIDAVNRRGGGAMFRIEVPARRTDAAPEATAPVAADGGGAPRILAVDDHPSNLAVVKAYLEALGCDVVCCEDGPSAVAAVRASPFDLVFMDVHMPGMDGLAATRMIRSLESGETRTPIVALTAAATEGDVAACLDAGMDGHLSKPIRPDRLAATIVKLAAARGRGQRLSRPPAR